MKKNIKNRILYMGANYAAYFLNFFSGLVLARHLGPENRGELAFISSLYLITLLLAPMNSKNGSTFASIKKGAHFSENLNFPFKRFLIWAFFISSFSTVVFILLLVQKVNIESLVIFSISNIACGLTFYIYFFEGIYRAEENILYLAVLRFLGLAIPSIYIFILLIFDQIKVSSALLSQLLALLACLIFVRKRRPHAVRFGYLDFVSQVKRTYLSNSLEYMANFIILFSVTLTESKEVIGYFSIALSLTMISETFFPLVETRMFKRLRINDAQARCVDKKPLWTAIIELLISQILFIPLAFMIPFVYGSSYKDSVEFAIILIIAKCNYSIVKLCNLFAAAVNSYQVAVKLNIVFIGSYLLIFCGLLAIDSRSKWQISAIIASLISALLGLIITKNLKTHSATTGGNWIVNL